MLFFENFMPEHFFGVHGLVKLEKEYHLMGSDDGHYWTKAILDLEEVIGLRIALKNLNYLLEKNPEKWRFSGTLIEFPFKVYTKYDKKSAHHIMAIEINDKKVSFSQYWLKDLIKALVF